MFRGKGGLNSAFDFPGKHSFQEATQPKWESSTGEFLTAPPLGLSSSKHVGDLEDPSSYPPTLGAHCARGLCVCERGRWWSQGWWHTLYLLMPNESCCSHTQAVLTRWPLSRECVGGAQQITRLSSEIIHSYLSSGNTVMKWTVHFWLGHSHLSGFIIDILTWPHLQSRTGWCLLSLVVYVSGCY